MKFKDIVFRESDEGKENLRLFYNHIEYQSKYQKAKIKG